MAKTEEEKAAERMARMAEHFGHLFHPKYLDKKTRHLPKEQQKWVATKTWYLKYTGPCAGCDKCAKNGNPTGTTHEVTRSLKTRDEKEAKQKRLETMLQAAKGTSPWIVAQDKDAENEKKNPPLTRLWDLVRTDYTIHKRRTRKNLENNIAKLTRFFEGEVPPVTHYAQVTTEIVNKYIAHEQEFGRSKTPGKKGAAASTINGALNALHKAFTLGVNHELIDKIPHWQNLEPANPIQRYFTAAEFNQFHAAMTKRDPDVADVCEFMYVLGWRYQEPLQLRWAWVNEIASTITLEGQKTKNGDDLVIPYSKPARLKALIEKRIRITRERQLKLGTGTSIPWIFTRDETTKKHGYVVLQIKKFEHVWDSCLRDCGWSDEPGPTKLTRHSFVRTAVGNWRKATDEKTGMQMMNKKTREIYDRYTVVDYERKVEALGNLEDVLDEADAKATARQAEIAEFEKRRQG